ncbi:MAG: right-handed parallel beta-helix repeat-containing protein [Deltaproteobacteria bacterium]|nr:right-handed parallel beta-helix repeat-containing protein [Deltaproteobacteria bacterium]
MMSKRATVLCLSGLSLLGLAGCAEKNLYDCYQGALDADERRDCIATGKADVTVEAGGSISQAMFDMPAEATRWVIKVRPGTYRETVAIDRSGVMLVGATSADNPEERVIIEGALDGGKQRKDAVIVSGSRFVMDGITMRNFSGNGVTVSKSTGVTLRNLVADKTGHYGVYPVESEDILVEGCTTSGIDDAGIYVGQSRRATVRGNHVFGNVAGIEIENTVTALVENNDVHDNTAGIMAFVLPNNPSKEGRDCTIRNNKTYRNNGKNFADPNAFVAKLPYGIGIGIMAADNTVVEKNEIYDNSSTGVALIGLQLFFTDPTKLDVEPNSDRARITGNTYRGNGKAPDPAYVNGAPVKLLGADVMWDSTGQGNCIDEPQGGELKTDGAAAALPRCK